ncbi:MAG: ClpXP protease specificity-enhancing factor SspB [Rhodobacteraceae bacterium]|nr:ClpXP protease specificity-enhancing factor SspB [Paracoccaceae bacterium]
MSRSIDYSNLMHQAMHSAMRGVIYVVLQDVMEHGLPGEHHFFITFDTSHPEVELADWIKDRFPGEMNIVLQHEFEDLDVTEEGFSVTLSFGDVPERLYIPYAALKNFVDPSVEFGLQFQALEGAEDPKETLADAEPEEPLQEKADAEVVSLDSFRK